jgi:O-antigen ligase
VKWVGLIIVLGAILPLSDWLRAHPRGALKVWCLLGFLPFALSFIHLNMAFISWLGWPGYVKGAEFSVLDALAIALYRGTPGPPQPIPFRLSMLFYFLATIVSSTQAIEPLASLFYSWQLARVFLVYATVKKGCANPRVPIAILTGMTAALFIEVAVATWQRFGLGMVQAPGTMVHQNLLGMMTQFVSLPAFALVLSGEVGWIITAAVPAAIFVDILTTSRGALGFSLLGCAIIFVLSSLRSWTNRKRKILTIGALGLLLIVPLAITSFDKRFSEQADVVSSDYDERAAFERAAQMMLADNPLGQGANHYVMSGITRGYNNRAGVIPVATSLAANVHNVYLLVAAETGYLGLITFVFMLLLPMVTAFLGGWKNRQDQRGDLLIGLGVTLLTVYIHNFYEWIFVMLETQYIFAIDVGLVAGLALQLSYWSKMSFRANNALRETSLAIKTRLSPTQQAQNRNICQEKI